MLTKSPRLSVGPVAYSCDMEHSSIADMTGWRSLAIQVGLGAVGVFSFVILFSFGGQLIVAPALLPVQWLLARHTDGWVASAFSILGALLVFEVLLVGAGLVLGDNGGAVVAGTGLGLLGAIVFFRTSRER